MGCTATGIPGCTTGWWPRWNHRTKPCPVKADRLLSWRQDFDIGQVDGAPAYGLHDAPAIRKANAGKYLAAMTASGGAP